ncbi:hypothetical protein FIU87_03525 [Bacillus sp. THAF10]|uniref:hypothetical protein n=1 Tax=Bacillus sp. THAF10 TaxID=2587848 RepID=UPI001267F452|nr:hypothetical protein [Bacillus sp. THAF10]QFT87713.1 hypothetical protein FIU87_03525 [Bacillus sp. THAF10]
MSKSIDYDAFKKMTPKKQAQTLTNLMLQGKHEIVQRLIHGGKQGSTEASEKIHRDSKKRVQPSQANLYKRDFCTADEFRYNHAQNADSNRSSREVLAGSGSNLFGGKRRRKRG